MTDLKKYPRTMNLPFSDSNSSDDVWWKDCKVFEGKEVVVSIKNDGENSNLYRDHIHARSLDTDNHPSRTWLKNYHSTFAHEIPDNWRICGENMFAFHSIFYTDLPSYFLAFGIYDDRNMCLSWADTTQFLEILGIQHVPIIYQGIWDEELVRSLWPVKSPYPTYGTGVNYPTWPQDFTPCPAEGYVVRLAESFHYDDFKRSCAKYVGKSFRNDLRDIHWASATVVPNLLRNDS